MANTKCRIDCVKYNAKWNIEFWRKWNAIIMYPREMETGSKERDGGGEGKSFAHERGSVRGERFSVIMNHIVSTCTGNVLRMICFTLSNSKLHVCVHVAIHL